MKSESFRFRLFLFATLLTSAGLIFPVAASGQSTDELVEVVRPAAERESSPSASLGELTILGVRSADWIRSFSSPPDVWLSHVPTAEPSEFFVCRLSHLSDSERTLLADAADGHWDNISFLDAVLIAEGLADEQRQESRLLFDRLLTQLRAETDTVSGELEKARIVFEFMHRRVLTGSYNLNRSSAAVSLATGVYNCVSATVLFNAFSRGVGLETNGLETTGHAKSRLILGDSYLDIETTCPTWELLPDKITPRETLTTVARPLTDGEASGADFEPNRAVGNESTIPNADDLTAGRDSGAVRYRKRPVREVSPVEFVATIYYNKGVDFYQERRFGPAIAAYLKAAALDPNNKTVLGNLKATLNNLAIELAMRRNFSEAIRLTEQGLKLDPQFDQFKANLPLYYRHWSEDLRKAGRLDEAEQVRQRQEIRFPAQKAENLF